jgi:hypothetical protein
MKNIVVLLLVVFFLVSCKYNDDKISEKTLATTLQKGCYVYNENGNIISMEIIKIENEITGNLIYNLRGKDINEGTFVGSVSDDKLIGQYTFSSEGNKSTREVAFLIKGNQLIEGFGELNEPGSAFKDKNIINYNSNMPLTKMDCNSWKQTCLYINGKAFSSIRQDCLDLDSLSTTLGPLKDGAQTTGKSAYLLFNKTQAEAEIFLPNRNEGIVLQKSNTGNWQNREYKLISWKGFVLQYNGEPIFGGN